MACMTHWTSIIVYVVFYLISSLVIYTRVDVMSEWANVTTCIGTHADIYKSLASDKNSFNIESALYPANEPSSVLVLVNIYGQNGQRKTGDDSVPGLMKYTLSLRSLYAAFPTGFPGDLIPFLDIGDSTHAGTKHHNSILLLQCFRIRQEKND